jgi:hypothetical protein
VLAGYSVADLILNFSLIWVQLTRTYVKQRPAIAGELLPLVEQALAHMQAWC